MEPDPKVIVRADKVAEELNADVLLYNGPLASSFDDTVISICQKRRRRDNVALILVTTGGDADAAYRIARCLQRGYKQFTLIVPGLCKSAGTLLALGAHWLVIFDHGELGPLDVQMSKKDELWAMQSGLTVNTALSALQARAYLAWERFFLDTELQSGERLKVTTAADIAVKLTTGLFAPLYAQIDPLHVGEAARAIQIAEQYGTRLLEHSGNSTHEALHELITRYPDHRFVIDRAEAEMLFVNVREPTEAEGQLVAALGNEARIPFYGSDATVLYLSREIDEKTEAKNEKVAADTVDDDGLLAALAPAAAEPGRGGQAGPDRPDKSIAPGAGTRGDGADAGRAVPPPEPGTRTRVGAS